MAGNRRLKSRGVVVNAGVESRSMDRPHRASCWKSRASHVSISAEVNFSVSPTAGALTRQNSRSAFAARGVGVDVGMGMDMGVGMGMGMDMGMPMGVLRDGVPGGEPSRRSWAQT